MAYKYYEEILLEEHMLFASEIVEMYGLKGVLAPLSVNIMIRVYCKKNNIKTTSYYYKTGKGLVRVYSKELYEPVLKAYIQASEDGRDLLKKGVMYVAANNN